ncbi:MAG: FAD-dependent oxidoreductase, partial [Melioribacteraceae bacterium]
MDNKFDVIIIGGGAAGLMCALTAGKRGRKVLLLEHADRVGKKILISGGGRCNFTNLTVQPENFVSDNPHFCKSALSRFTQNNFIELVENHEIPYYEKEFGQLFCSGKSGEIVELLLKECRSGDVEIRTNCKIENIGRENGFYVNTNC